MKGNQSISFEVHDALGRTLCFAFRIPRQHSGWRSVQYRGERYQLFGGIRTPHWIRVEPRL